MEDLSEDAAHTTGGLWTEARAILADALNICGAPEWLAGRRTLPRHAHRTRVDFIRFAERLVRRLIIIAAAATLETLAPARRRESEASAPSSASRPASRGGVARPRPVFDPDAPASNWRTSFPILRQSPAPRPYRAGAAVRHNRLWREACSRAEAAGLRKPFAPPYQPAPFAPAGALARRLEALRRVIDDPAPYVLRTARRMQRIRAANLRANAPLVFRAASPPLRKRPSLGWIRCGPAIDFLESRTNAALRRLDPG